MERFIYSVVLGCSRPILYLLSLFNLKIRKFLEGRKGVFKALETQLQGYDKIVWFHAASHGEYEMALPLMQEIKKEFTDCCLLLTFFSPSGYEAVKESSLATVTTYLPLDTQKNSRRFLEITQPVLCVFIRYEFWPNYLIEIERKKIATLLISGLFKQEQIFFKWYGGFMRKRLGAFTQFFVQDEKSQQLLNHLGFKNVEVGGDIRYARVLEIANKKPRLSFMETFSNGAYCFVAGSTWPEDEAILADYINKFAPETLKVVIAPHEIKEKQIKALQNQLHKKAVLYSEKSDEKLAAAKILILDTIGLLSKVYAYANIAWVGGAAGKTGLHNVLEPAAWAKPVIVGPHYKNHPEAVALNKNGGLFIAKEAKSLKRIVNSLLYKSLKINNFGESNRIYVEKESGKNVQMVYWIRKYLRNISIN